MKPYHSNMNILGVTMALSLSITYAPLAHSEYGDIVINNYSDAVNMRPPIFPHWFHRIRFRCRVCHSDLGFQFKAGGNKINMQKIISGEYCGACHNGTIAWSVDNCEMCHSGQAGTPTQVHKSTLQTLIAPVARPSSNFSKSNKSR